MTCSFKVPATPPAYFIAAFSSGLASALRNFDPLVASPQIIISLGSSTFRNIRSFLKPASARYDLYLSKMGRHFA
jgi:hypothetical protein